MLVRPYEESDFDRVVARWHETNRISYRYVAEHQRHTPEDARAFFRERVLPECRVYVADGAGAPAGVLALAAPWILQLAVFPEFQRRGVGTALLQRAREDSPRELRLHTFARNAPARAFYGKHGFYPFAFGVSPAPELEPDVLYRWVA